MRRYRLLLVAAIFLALAVIALGAYVRLSDAGLGCPDWPGCYGHLIGVPDEAHEKTAALQGFPDRPVDTPKAWKEMSHRYLAGALGLLIVMIAVLAWRRESRHERPRALSAALVGVVGLQAMLGMWTVTLLLKPVIVTAHLLGGMATLGLLICLLLSTRPVYRPALPMTIRLLAALALSLVIGQIALGGWVSSNYAALACGDFPRCGGMWWPEMDFTQAFGIQRELGQTEDGELLSNAALTAIHWTHRSGAFLVALIVGTLALLLLRHPAWRPWGALLGLALLVQIGLGIAAVLLALPLAVAVAHNAGAALLLSITLALNVRAWRTSWPAYRA